VTQADGQELRRASSSETAYTYILRQELISSADPRPYQTSLRRLDQLATLHCACVTSLGRGARNTIQDPLVRAHWQQNLSQAGVGFAALGPSALSHAGQLAGARCESSLEDKTVLEKLSAVSCLLRSRPRSGEERLREGASRQLTRGNRRARSSRPAVLEANESESASPLQP